MEALEQELKIFGENEAEWSKAHPGKFVLIKGHEVIGFFDEPEPALSTGARLVGAESFLVRKLDKSDENIYIPALALGLLHADPS
jgi:hypothetical protein